MIGLSSYFEVVDVGAREYLERGVKVGSESMAALVYSDGQVFAAELLGTTTMCVVGLGGIANAVLPGTKGHGIGFLGIAFCFGLGVFLPLQFVGHISGTTLHSFP